MLRRLLVPAVLAAATLPAAGPAMAAAPAGTAGALSLGDSLYPRLGNGGYDAKHYSFTLKFGAASTDPVTGTETLTATATQALSSFSLDLAPAPIIGAVTVNGLPATTSRTADKLIITPRKVLPAGKDFVVKINGLSTTATPFSEDDPASVAFVAAPSGSYTAPQPQYAHYVVPVNDHPLDKATYHFRLTAPPGQTAFANGKLSTKEKAKNGSTTWTFAQRQPMASELIQFGAGAYRMVDQGVGSGVRLRNYIAKGAGNGSAELLADNARQMAWVVKRLGTYPFDTYGVLVADEDVGFALETQTLSLFSGVWFDDPDAESWLAPTMVHELVHQWYGDSVSPKDWADIWIAEGHATWYEALYAADEGYFGDYSGGFSGIEGLAHGLYEYGNYYRDTYGPVGRPLSGADADLFSPQSYYGGFLVLYALRQQIGTAKFEKLEREYVTRYRGQTKGTADYIALASKIAGQDLSGFLNAWLYGTTTPPMPGHPDWISTLAPEPAARSAAPSATALITPTIRLARR